MIFPVICPVCQSDSGRRVLPTSPEVETYRCGNCHREWSERATFPTAAQVPTPSMIEAWRRRLHIALSR